jgi:hypothetical protein
MWTLFVIDSSVAASRSCTSIRWRRQTSSQAVKLEPRISSCYSTLLIRPRPSDTIHWRDLALPFTLNLVGSAAFCQAPPLLFSEANIKINNTLPPTIITQDLRSSGAIHFLRVFKPAFSNLPICLPQLVVG